LLAATIGQSAAPKSPAQPPTGPFGLSMIRTADQALADLDLFQATETCGVCHPRQFEELKGSMHLASHTDPLYRATAELARKEAGPKVYAFCSGCHSPAGVLTGLIPAKPDGNCRPKPKPG
jgi:cytochrome c553